MELAKTTSKITGKGIIKGTKRANTETSSTSAKILPKSRKLSDSGLVKSSRMLIGKRIGVVSRLIVKIPLRTVRVSLLTYSSNNYKYIYSKILHYYFDLA